MDWSKIKTHFLFLIPVIFTFVLFFPVILNHSLFIGNFQDILNYDYVFLKENPAGLWNNLWPGGYPEIANPLSSRYYPVTQLSSFWFDSTFIFNFIVLLHIFIAFISFYFFGSILTKHRLPLVFFSCMYSFSGAILTRIHGGHLSIIFALSWAPLFFYFLFTLLVKHERNLKNILGLALTAAILYTSGGFYHFIFLLIFAFIFFVYQAIKNRKSAGKWAFLLAMGIAFCLIGIKLIPELFISPYLVRIDPINPLEGGGTLLSSLSSFMFGTPIDNNFGIFESAAFLGIVPVLLVIYAFVFGKKEITIPSFISLCCALVWALGGGTVLSFVHLFPVLNNFRVPGRILGAITPLLLFLALYGVVLLLQEQKRNNIVVSEDHRRYIRNGVMVLFLIFLTSLPFFKFPDFHEWIILGLVLIFIIIIYSNSLTFSRMVGFLVLGLVINLFDILISLNITSQMVLQLGICAIVLALAVYLFTGEGKDQRIVMGICAISLIIIVLGNLQYIQPEESPLENSPAREVVNKIKEYPSTNPQVWILDTGWPYMHVDFTYWYIDSGIHPMRGYFPYFLKNQPSIEYVIGNTTYSAADYIVDTAVIDVQNPTLPYYSFKVGTIGVLKATNVMPVAGVIRDGELIRTELIEFSSDRVTLKGSFRSGDVAFLKYAYYPGWTMNGRDAKQVENLIGGIISEDENLITFRYEPIEFRFGVLLSLIGVILIFISIWRRDRINKFFNP